MFVIIIGCNKYGSLLATELSNAGNDVTIIDKSSNNLNLLGSGFNGNIIHGVEIDTEVLKDAGIENADVFLGMTQNDNINIMACQIAKSIFNVPIILAKVYDPKREYIYDKLGIKSINPTTLCINKIKGCLSCEL